ncbi:hypothetical protein CEXT_588031 [Caerostris extrusa]|uniref:Uncharacterized protein n=1 Tax=Caerostris extrusa TaxID=172846 RepID=A0AAV4PIN1_CAEEX|nr:hypothetical protein CEXT_588031 [Caerostris extrusa]
MARGIVRKMKLLCHDQQKWSTGVYQCVTLVHMLCKLCPRLTSIDLKFGKNDKGIWCHDFSKLQMMRCRKITTWKFLQCHNSLQYCTEH